MQAGDNLVSVKNTSATASLREDGTIHMVPEMYDRGISESIFCFCPNLTHHLSHTWSSTVECIYLNVSCVGIELVRINEKYMAQVYSFAYGVDDGESMESSCVSSIKLHLTH